MPSDIAELREREVKFRVRSTHVLVKRVEDGSLPTTTISIRGPDYHDKSLPLLNGEELTL